jgi:hypothetical protein
MFGDNSLTGVTDVEFVGSNCYVLTTGSASSKNKIYKFKNYNFTDFTKISSNIQKSNLQSGWYELSVKHNKLIVGEKIKFILLIPLRSTSLIHYKQLLIQVMKYLALHIILRIIVILLKHLQCNIFILSQLIYIKFLKMELSPMIF